MNYEATLKSARMQLVIDAFDSDANPATLELCTASYAAVLAIITLAKPSFAESNAVITMRNVPRASTGIVAGQAALARIKDGSGLVRANNLSVGTSNADVIVNTTSVMVGEPITVMSAQISHAA